MPGQMIAPPPTRALRRIVGPFIKAFRRSVRPMKLSFVVTTHGAMNTSSSRVEYAVMYASAWMRVPAPTVVSFSISEPRPRMQSSAISTPSPLGDAALVADGAVRVDRRARKGDRARRDDGAVADSHRRQRIALRGRLRAERRLLAHDRVLQDPHSLAEDRAFVDGGRGVDLSQ